MEEREEEKEKRKELPGRGRVKRWLKALLLKDTSLVCCVLFIMLFGFTLLLCLYIRALEGLRDDHGVREGLGGSKERRTKEQTLYIEKSWSVPIVADILGGLKAHE